jgi:DNA helicase-2/ATP-dependent DNA helicase PcrA
VKKTSNYAGKTYNSVDGVREFFNRQAGSAGVKREPVRDRYKRGTGEHPSKREQSAGEPVILSGVEFRVGARVRHARYGTGVVLRSEGAGDDAKLTVSFPGYGQKKFVAKFAALEKV